MKKKYLVITAILLSGCYACNNDEKKEEASGEAITEVAKPSELTPAPEAPYDPDPSDTIPGDKYSINSNSKQTADLVRLTLKDQLKTDLEKNLVDSLSRKFIFFEYDLNDDGKKEIFVGLTGPYFCGSGGCSPYLLDNQGNIITHFSVSDYPIVVDNNKTNDWKDLIVYSGGKNRIIKFDGKKYPSNPSTLPVLKVTLADELPKALNFINEPYPWFKF